MVTVALLSTAQNLCRHNPNQYHIPFLNISHSFAVQRVIRIPVNILVMACPFFMCFAQTRRWVFALCLVLMLCVSAGMAAPGICDTGDGYERVLIIHSYGPDMDWVGSVTEGIERVFSTGDPCMIFYTEYMDGKVVSDDEHYDNLAAVYRHKYASVPPDLILVSDDDAYAFIRMHGDDLFSGVPVVFFGVSGYDAVHHTEGPQMTGIVEDMRIGPTLDLITTLHPGVREVYVVNDPGTTTGKIFADELDAWVRNHGNSTAVRAPGETRITALRHDLRNLTPGDAVLLMDFNRDNDGRTYSDREIAGIVSDWSPAPVYGVSDTFIGHGVVGGVVSPTADQAEYAARMGADVLNGTPVMDIPVSGPPEAHVMVDYGEMQRHAIPVSLLPEGSQVVNVPDEGIVLPPWLVASLLVVAGSLLVLVVVLVCSNRRIQAARHDLDASNRKLKTLFSITRHDINNQVMVASGYLEILSDEITQEDLREYISPIRKSLHNIEHQIAFAREYEKAGVSDPVWQKLRDVAEFAAAHQHGLLVDIAGGDIEVFADPMLGKVFANLFDNAMRHGDHVTRVQVTEISRGDDRVIVVEDDGVGVPDEKKGLIFERGYGENTGYGLFLASDILAVTGLSITETGTYGSGARFEITVPKGRWRILR